MNVKIKGADVSVKEVANAAQYAYIDKMIRKYYPFIVALAVPCQTATKLTNNGVKVEVHTPYSDMVLPLTEDEMRHLYALTVLATEEF